METRTLIRITLAAGMIAAIGGAGCSLVKAEETDASPDKVVGDGDVSEILKSTLQLQGGCTAAKVGPKHLLVAARCVNGNAAFAAGKTISFTVASSGKAPVGPGLVAASDAGTPDAAPVKDAGASDSAATATDSGPASDSGTAASNPNAKDVTIADVKIHPSFVAKCTADLCDFTKTAASNSPDIAIILLEEELETVPTIPVDLDPVGAADPLLAVSSGCATFDAKPSAPKAIRTTAVPAKSVNHKGSLYAASPNLVPQLASSYVVTQAAGWRSGQPRLCKTDIGAPLFRADSAAVAGVTSNYTTYGSQKLPVTTHHTRVDAQSRFKIGEWLTTLGAETVHSCSETPEGCVKRTFDGGEPPGPATDNPGTEPGDGGPVVGDAEAPDAAVETPAEPLPEDSAPRTETLPPDEESDETSGSNDLSDDAGAPKKKKKAEGGCSAAPGATAPSGGMVIGLALALGAVIARRRRK
jgi:MYXO-CTERM domain-containing protein